MVLYEAEYVPWCPLEWCRYAPLFPSSHCAVTAPERHPLVDSFVELVDTYWRDDSPPVLVPRGLLHDVRTVNPIFRGYQQHDSQACLTQPPPAPLVRTIRGQAGLCFSAHRTRGLKTAPPSRASCTALSSPCVLRAVACAPAWHLSMRDLRRAQ